MSDIMIGISGLLSNAWRFLMHTLVPGTQIAFGVFFIGLALIPVGFEFLSIAVGHNVGEVGTSGGKYGARGSKRVNVSQKRKGDTK